MDVVDWATHDAVVKERDRLALRVKELEAALGEKPSEKERGADATKTRAAACGEAEYAQGTAPLDPKAPVAVAALDSKKRAAPAPDPTSPSGDGPRQVVREKKLARVPTYASPSVPPAAAAEARPVLDEGPVPGTRFEDEGTTWIVYRRGGQRMPVSTKGGKTVYKELDVVYYYDANDGEPTVSNYVDQCEYSGVDEVRAWIARTQRKARAKSQQPVPRSRDQAAAGAKSQDPVPHSRDQAAAAAAAARPRPVLTSVSVDRSLLGRTVQTGVGPRSTGTVAACTPSGICTIVWEDNSTSDILRADVRHILAPLAPTGE